MGRGDTSNVGVPGLSSRLKESREALGVSQRQAAELIGVTENTVYRYEAGKVAPSNTTLKAIAQVYGKSAEWFLGENQRAVAERGPEYLTDDERGILRAFRETPRSRRDMIVRVIHAINEEAPAVEKEDKEE